MGGASAGICSRPGGRMNRGGYGRPAREILLYLHRLPGGRGFVSPHRVLVRWARSRAMAGVEAGVGVGVVGGRAGGRPHTRCHCGCGGREGAGGTRPPWHTAAAAPAASTTRPVVNRSPASPHRHRHHHRPLSRPPLRPHAHASHAETCTALCRQTVGQARVRSGHQSAPVTTGGRRCAAIPRPIPRQTARASRRCCVCASAAPSCVAKQARWTQNKRVLASFGQDPATVKAGRGRCCGDRQDQSALEQWRRRMDAAAAVVAPVHSLPLQCEPASGLHQQ